MNKEKIIDMMYYFKDIIKGFLFVWMWMAACHYYATYFKGGGGIICLYLGLVYFIFVIFTTPEVIKLIRGKNGR